MEKFFEALPYGFFKCAKKHGLTLINIAMDWMLAPSMVHSHAFRVTQLFIISMRLVLATDVAEVNPSAKEALNFVIFINLEISVLKKIKI